MQRIGLVACCGEKLPRPAPARDLYRSELFRRSRAYAERTCDAWAVLSAEHGVLDPDAVVAPYDTTLARMPAAARRRWADRVRRDLAARFPGARFTVLAGREYRRAVEGLPHTAPTAGLGIGEQLSWLGKRIVGPRYLMALTNREYIKVRGERRPFWEFLDEEPAGWLSSLAYRANPAGPGGLRMLDCGAWSYKDADEPRVGNCPVTPEWAVTQYAARARPGDFAIAPDHMLIPGLGDLKARRRFNRASAERFLAPAAAAGLRPMAAVHGETVAERVAVARQYVKMGYRALALGGLAGQATRRRMAVAVVRAVREAVPGVWVHVLGLSSPDYVACWRRLGVESCDGSSHFKKAFTAGEYYVRDGASLAKYRAARPGEPVAAPACTCKACDTLRAEGVDTRSYGSNEHNMGRAAHNLNQLIAAQFEAMAVPPVRDADLPRRTPGRGWGG